jgi:hypothetical protein
MRNNIVNIKEDTHSKNSELVLQLFRWLCILLWIQLKIDRSDNFAMKSFERYYKRLYIVYNNHSLNRITEDITITNVPILTN